MNWHWRYRAPSIQYLMNYVDFYRIFQYISVKISAKLWLTMVDNPFQKLQCDDVRTEPKYVC